MPYGLVVVNRMEFDATVIQVKGLVTFKTRFNPPFCFHEKMPLPSQEYDSSYLFV